MPSRAFPAGSREGRRHLYGTTARAWLELEAQNRGAPGERSGQGDRGSLESDPRQTPPAPFRRAIRGGP